jgi:hypothetical protein
MFGSMSHAWRALRYRNSQAGSLLAVRWLTGLARRVIFTGASCAAGSVWFTLNLAKVNAIMHPI